MFRGIHFWNQLPLRIRKEPWIHMFKKLLNLIYWISVRLSCWCPQGAAILNLLWEGGRSRGGKIRVWTGTGCYRLRSGWLNPLVRWTGWPWKLLTGSFSMRRDAEIVGGHLRESVRPQCRVSSCLFFRFLSLWIAAVVSGEVGQAGIIIVTVTIVLYVSRVKFWNCNWMTISLSYQALIFYLILRFVLLEDDAKLRP